MKEATKETIEALKAKTPISLADRGEIPVAELTKLVKVVKREEDRDFLSTAIWFSVIVGLGFLVVILLI